MLAWFTLIVMGSACFIAIIAIIVTLVGLPFKKDIRENCSEISYAKFRNILSFDGFDSIQKNGDISLSNRTQEICESMTHLNKIENNISKDSRGYIEFWFYDKQDEYLGHLTLQYKPLSHGYFIDFGFFSEYGCSALADLLLSEVKSKYPKVRNFRVHPDP
jgi:hypothetical protein